MKIVSFFDIETAALPEEQIKGLMPEFTAPANYKDAEKIKANIEAQAMKWLSEAALSPITGQILVIGVMVGDQFYPLEEATEKELLSRFWGWVRTELYAGNEIAGWCCHHFDWPFAIKRSWTLGVPVPAGLRTGDAQQYWHPQLIDLQRRWQMGDQGCESSLDLASKFCGLPGKLGSGADFGKLWTTDKPAALAYLQRDLELTRDLYQRMTFCN